MTTIAIDSRTVAADGMSCVGDEIIDLDMQKIIVKYGRVYAITGSQPLGMAAIDWHMAGATPGSQPGAGGNIEWSLIVIEGTAPIRSVTKYTSAVPYPDVYPIPQAFGSGCEYAMGALLHGASPREAVEIAAKLNSKTGGAIKVVDIEHALAGKIVVMAAE